MMYIYGIILYVPINYIIDNAIGFSDINFDLRIYNVICTVQRRIASLAGMLMSLVVETFVNRSLFRCDYKGVNLA